MTDYITLNEETYNKLRLFREKYDGCNLSDRDDQVLRVLIGIAEENGYINSD